MTMFMGPHFGYFVFAFPSLIPGHPQPRWFLELSLTAHFLLHVHSLPSDTGSFLCRPHAKLLLVSQGATDPPTLLF